MNVYVCQHFQKLLDEIHKDVGEKSKNLKKGESIVQIHNKVLILDKRALGVLHIQSKLRLAVLYITEWKWFDRFIIFVIFLNSVFLAAYDYSDKDDQTERNQIVEIAGRTFTCIFTTECILKIIGFGFIFHKNSYLRDGWNWLDFIVVIIGWIELLPEIPNLRGLRTLRVLRPLRSINAIPSMRNQIASLIKSLGQLVNVLLFLMFLFIIFGILGVQLYQGQFYQRCRLTPAPDQYGNWPIDPSVTRLCAYPDTDGWFYCPSNSYCGSPDDYGLSLSNENFTSAPYINFGITTFDNLGIGMLTIFQVITLEGWSDLMYMLMDSGTPWMAALYFIVLVLLGYLYINALFPAYRSYFLMNITLVVVIANYSQTKEDQKKDDQRKDKEHNISKHTIKVSDGAQHNININNDDAGGEDHLPQMLFSPQQKQSKQATARTNFSDKKEKDNKKSIRLKAQLRNDDKEVNSSNLTASGLPPLLSPPYKQIILECDSEVSKDEEELKKIVNEVQQITSTRNNMDKIIDRFNNSQSITSNNNYNNKSNKSHNNNNDKNTIEENILSHELENYSGMNDDNKLPSLPAIGRQNKLNATFYEMDSKLIKPEEIKESNQNQSSVLIQGTSKITRRNDQSQLSSSLNQNKQNVYRDKSVQSSDISFSKEDQKIHMIDEDRLTIENNYNDENNDDDYDKAKYATSDNFKEALNKKSSQEQLQEFQSELQEKQKNWLIKIQLFFFKISISSVFSIFIILLILMNTMILAMDRYPLDDASANDLDFINMILTWFFFSEMVIKLIGLGPKIYVKDKFNIFDGIITILTTIENLIDLAALGSGISTNGAISGFRAIRLFKIFKLARQLKSFQLMLTKIALSLKDIGNFSILLFLFLLTYNLMGLELFSFKVKFDADGNLDLVNGQSPRTNFDNLLNGFVTIFIVLIGDNWNWVMYDFMNACGSWSAIFFVFLQVFGKYVLLNLFLAILLENFSDDKETQETETDDKEKSLYNKFKKKILSLFKRNQVQIESNSQNIISLTVRSVGDDQESRKDPRTSDQNFEKGYSTYKTFRQDSSITPALEKQSKFQSTQRVSDFEKGNNDDYFETPKNQAKTTKTLDQDENHKEVNEQFSVDPNLKGERNSNGHIENDENVDQAYSSNRDLLARTASLKSGKKKKNLMEDLIERSSTLKQKPESILEGKSLCILGKHSKLRRFLFKIVTYKLFDPFILFLILFSSIALAIDNPLDDPNGQVQNILMIIDIIISLALDDLNINFIKVLRMLRVLRPLRMVSKNEGLKLAVLSLMNSIPGIINALVIGLLFFLLFGIFGTNYFKGKFYYCLTDNIDSIVDTSVISTKWDCMNVGGEWVNQETNFDNILLSMNSLFILSSTEGWADIMFNAVDSVDIDYNPVNNNNEGYVFFFITFMIVGSLFTLNLFVSIVVDTYYNEKDKLNKNELLSQYQKLWLQVEMVCFESKPLKPKTTHQNKVSKFFQKIADSPYFDGFIILCILVNTILLALNWYQNPQTLDQDLEYVNYFFTAIFTLEAFIKIIAYGLDYFKQGWNIFDFIIVLISYITLIISHLSSAQVGPKQTTIARAFRIGRVFRLIKKAKFLRIIFNTIIVTIPSLANVGALMFLLLFIFSILGVQTFATVKLQDNLNEHANFQNFGIAILTLIRLQTGEGWNNILEDTLRQQSVIFDCNNNPTYQSIVANGGEPDGCGTQLAYLFFFAFQLIVTIIFLNLFVAVILQGFTSSNEEEGLEIYKKNIQDFLEIWKKYDENGTGYILVDELSNLIDDLEENTDLICQVLQKDESRKRFFISSLQIPTYQLFQKYYFQDILSCLERKYIAHQYVIEELKELQIEDPGEYSQQMKIKEQEFEDIIEGITDLAETKKIQMIEVNQKKRTKYSNKMFNKVDKFEGNIYDSSYIVWVPVIQKRIRPLLQRIAERKKKFEERKLQFQKQKPSSLVIETGCQLNNQFNSGNSGQGSSESFPIQIKRGEVGHQTTRNPQGLLSSEWNPTKNQASINQNNNNNNNNHSNNNNRSLLLPTFYQNHVVENFGQNGEIGGTQNLTHGEDSHSQSNDPDYQLVVMEEFKEDSLARGMKQRRLSFRHSIL